MQTWNLQLKDDIFSSKKSVLRFIHEPVMKFGAGNKKYLPQMTVSRYYRFDFFFAKSNRATYC